MSQGQFDTFSHTNLNTWIEAAKKELGGKDPFEALSISKNDLIVKPYYDKEDTKDLAENILHPSDNPYLGPRGWYNTPNINVKNCAEANKLALEYLGSGADGILFTLQTEAELDILLNQIELPYCGIFFITETEQSKLLNDFAQYVSSKGYDKSQVKGSVIWTDTINTQNVSLQPLQGFNNFHALGISIPKADNPVNEIADALLAAVDILNAGDTDTREIIHHIHFSFTVGTDFFTEIAKIRAFRRLWVQVCHAFAVTDKDDTHLLHAISTAWNKESFQPNANMLKSTTAALSAILGGCDAITVMPEEDNSFKNRIARNVLTILREESHLNQTADAVAGSYYLESLIDQMAKTAWEKFQQKVNS